MPERTEPKREDGMTDRKPTPYGPDNPHPLSTMRTELVWEGKYDEFGRRREVDVAACAMPMQRIETVDEPRQRAAAEGQMDMFEQKLMQVREEAPAWPEFRNRLIWGDNKLVMASLLKEFKVRIDLIYIDPPFDVGADFTMNVPIGDERDNISKDQSTLEMVAYREMWGKGTDSYVHMLYERIMLIRDLLAEAGSIYVHCDWRVTHLIRILLDEVFGKESFRDEIIWRKLTAAKAQSSYFSNVKDTIYFYTKSDHSHFETQYIEGTEDHKNYAMIEDGTGRRYGSFDFTQKGDGPPRRFGSKILTPPAGKHWIWSQEKIDKGISEGRIIFTSSGLPRVKRYLDEKKGNVVGDLWADDWVSPLSANASERVEYATQKPESLLERVISASCPEGGLVADFFCGIGTTGAVAEKLGRRWIMADLGRFAIHTSRKRMIEVQRELHDAGKPYRAFDVYNLGRYERQWWQKERLKGADEEHRRVVLDFFKAETLTNTPSPLIHGRKGGAFCHVDAIDTIFTRPEATAVAKAVAEAGGRECYCLAWEFEMDIRLHTEALRKELGAKLKLIQIPREIMEKNRTSPPPFLEMAVLEAEVVRRRSTVSNQKSTFDIKLTRFMPSLAEVPTKELEALKERAIKSGFDFIDFWAVDFDWQPGKPFNHHWQDYRTRRDRTLRTVSDAGFEYPKKGKYTACVKVVDTFGCDTSISVIVDV